MEAVRLDCEILLEAAAAAADPLTPSTTATRPDLCRAISPPRRLEEGNASEL